MVSGFIIWIATAGPARSASAFAISRLARIAPTYWCVTLLSAAGASIRPWVFATEAPNWERIFQSLLFIPTPSPIIPQGWTLNIEVFFYAIFAATIHLRRPVQIAALSLGLTALAIAGAILPGQGIVAQTYLNPRLVEFAGGLWVGEFWMRGWLPKGWLGLALLCAGIVAAPTVLWLKPAHVWLSGGWMAASVMVVAGALTCENQFSIPKLPLLALVGDASYVIYLIHNPILSVFRLQLWLWLPLQWLGSVAACVLVGIACLPWERHASRIVRRSLSQWLRRGTPAAIGAP